MNHLPPLSMTLDAHDAVIRGDLPAARAALLRLESAAMAARLALPETPPAEQSEDAPEDDEP